MNFQLQLSIFLHRASCLQNPFNIWKTISFLVDLTSFECWENYVLIRRRTIMADAKSMAVVVKRLSEIWCFVDILMAFVPILLRLSLFLTIWELNFRYSPIFIRFSAFTLNLLSRKCCPKSAKYDYHTLPSHKYRVCIYVIIDYLSSYSL